MTFITALKQHQQIHNQTAHRIVLLLVCVWVYVCSYTIVSVYVTEHICVHVCACACACVYVVPSPEDKSNNDCSDNATRYKEEEHNDNTNSNPCVIRCCWHWMGRDKYIPRKTLNTNYYRQLHSTLWVCIQKSRNTSHKHGSLYVHSYVQLHELYKHVYVSNSYALVLHVW